MSVVSELMEVEQKSYDLTRPRRVFYIPVLSNHISYLSQLSVKLPMETLDTNLSRPMGTTYENIQRAFIDGVDFLEEMMKPCINQYTLEMKNPNRRYQADGETEHQFAKYRFGWCIMVLDEVDMLKERFISMNLVEEGELLSEKEMDEVRANWVNPYTGEKAYVDGKPRDDQPDPDEAPGDMAEDNSKQTTGMVAIVAKAEGQTSNRDLLLEAEANQSDNPIPPTEDAQLQSE